MCAQFDETIARSLYPCAPEQAFRFSDGQKARHVAQLRDVIEQCDPETLAGHSDDLPEWIRTVLRDPKLAKKMEGAVNNDNLEGHDFREKILGLLDHRIENLGDDADLPGIHEPRGPRARRLKRQRRRRRSKRRRKNRGK